jgi:hypothetical protein
LTFAGVYGHAMVLLSSMMRAQAITGRKDLVDQWLGGRQFGRWSQQPPNHSESLRALTELHERGVVSDAEFDALRSRIKA